MGLVPLSADDGAKPAARPSQAAVPGDVATLGYGMVDAPGRVSGGTRFDAGGHGRMTVTGRGSTGNRRLWKLLSNGRGRTLRLSMWARPLGAPQPGPGSLRAGMLRVATEPAGATVYVDGRAVGRSPVEVPNLTQGDHEVRVVRSAHQTAVRNVTLGERDETVRVTLQPLVSESGVSVWAWAGVAVLACLAVTNYLGRKKQASEGPASKGP